MAEVRKKLLEIISWIKTFCWRCGYRRNEWLGLRIFISRRGRCFYCRMDALDTKYGPSLQAELFRSKDGSYKRPRLTRWEKLWLRSGL